MSIKIKAFLKITLQAIFQGVVIALVIIIAERTGCL